jgi:hypothetical protein
MSANIDSKMFRGQGRKETGDAGMSANWRVPTKINRQERTVAKGIKQRLYELPDMIALPLGVNSVVDYLIRVRRRP